MRTRSHYMILGISKGESPEGIRAAYLRLVKTLHPDHAGESSTPAFREVQRAYDVLSDPKARRTYDASLDRKRPARERSTESLKTQSQVEPLVPDEPMAAPLRWDPSDLFDSRSAYAFAGLTPIGSSARPSEVAVDLDVVMSADQASRGGHFTLRIPFRETCPVCDGGGVGWLFTCAACERNGWIASFRAFGITMPPGIRHGTLVRFKPENPGDIVLLLRVLVEERMRAPPLW